MTYDKSRNPNGRGSSFFVFRKSGNTRTMDLRRAYETIKAYRDNLEKLIKCDITLHKYQKMKLHHESVRMSEWLKENEKIIMIEYIESPSETVGKY